MSELDPTTKIIRSVSEAQIIDDFGKYEGITIERLDDHTVKATFQEFFGEGSSTGHSVLNVLVSAVRHQKNYEYWRGYHRAEEEYKTMLEETLQESSERMESLEESINTLRAEMDAAIKHLASHVSHLALQFQLDHEKSEAQS
jgi:hypothetical protein